MARVCRVHARTAVTRYKCAHVGIYSAPRRRAFFDEPRVHHAGRGTTVEKTIGQFATMDDRYRGIEL